jgi:multidrug efflux system membrane fusion protein
MNRTLRCASLLAACGALALGTGACAKRGGNPPRPPATVTTAPAVSMDAPIVLETFGTTDARLSVEVVPQVSGVLLKSLIQDGAIVTNGQPLFLIDPRDYEARVRQAEAAVAADRANLELSRLTLERNRDLLAQKLIPAQAFDTLKARADAAAAQLEADDAALALARLNLQRCTITASLAGICSKRLLDDGNLAAAGVTRLTNIRSYDPMVVEFSVSEQYLPLIRRSMAAEGMQLEVAMADDTNRLAGRVQFVDNAVNPLTGTILLRGEVPNPDRRLWADQFVEVRLIASVLRDAVMVPESAVQFGKNGSYLYVVPADRFSVTTNATVVVTNRMAELRPVKTGIRQGGLFQIVEGVAAGENVVALGQLMLYPGAPVRDSSMAPAAPNVSPTNSTAATTKS